MQRVRECGNFAFYQVDTATRRFVSEYAQAVGIALAIDLGASKVEAALVDSTGTLIQGSRARAETGINLGSKELGLAVESVVRNATSRIGLHEIDGVGIGAAGPVDLVRGTVSPLNLPAWREFPLRDLVSSLLPGAQVELQIDGLCFALAEFWKGSAQGSSNLLGMVISTGIGGGLILAGQPFLGKSGNAGHIGHLQVSGFGDPVCQCGGRGCLEAIASGPSSVGFAKSKGWNGETGEELALSVRNGDPIALSAIERAGSAIGLAIGSASALLDLDSVVIGGGFAKTGSHLFDAIERGHRAHDSFSFSAKTRILPTTLGNDGPLIGAAALVHRDIIR